MWASHVVHHSSEYLTCLHCGRPLPVRYSAGFYLPWRCSVSRGEMLVIVGLIDLLYQYWVHTELIG